MQADLKASISEAFIAIDGALAASEILSRNEIHDQHVFNGMVLLMLEASASLAHVLAVASVENRIYPNADMARAAATRAPRVDGAVYEFRRDGTGRTAIRLVFSPL